MPESTRELVIVITRGADHELSSVAFTIANGGITAGLKVAIFLTSAGVDLVRKRAIDNLVVHPLEPLELMVKDFLSRGGRSGPARLASRREAMGRPISSTAWRLSARARYTS
jgi:predicted peroxiredoxin